MEMRSIGYARKRDGFSFVKRLSPNYGPNKADDKPLVAEECFFMKGNSYSGIQVAPHA